jgi:hypothetical protein
MQPGIVNRSRKSEEDMQSHLSLTSGTFRCDVFIFRFGFLLWLNAMNPRLSGVSYQQPLIVSIAQRLQLYMLLQLQYLL